MEFVTFCVMFFLGIAIPAYAIFQIRRIQEEIESTSRIAAFSLLSEIRAQLTLSGPEFNDPQERYGVESNSRELFSQCKSSLDPYLMLSGSIGELGYMSLVSPLYVEHLRGEDLWTSEDLRRGYVNFLENWEEAQGVRDKASLYKSLSELCVLAVRNGILPSEEVDSTDPKGADVLRSLELCGSALATARGSNFEVYKIMRQWSNQRGLEKVPGELLLPLICIRDRVLAPLNPMFPHRYSPKERLHAHKRLSSLIRDIVRSFERSDYSRTLDLLAEDQRQRMRASK